MHFSTLSATAILAVSSVSALPGLTGFPGCFTPDNKYCAQIPPWNEGAHPGWYNGETVTPFFNIFKILPGLNCSSSPNLYTDFKLVNATKAPDYLTYGLVDNVQECKKMCDCVANCNYANTYLDVNGKNGSTMLTCSLFTSCHGQKDATNNGGQTQPDGTVNSIADSQGHCKIF